MEKSIENISPGPWARWQIFPENDKIFLFDYKKNENSIEIFFGVGDDEGAYRISSRFPISFHAFAFIFSVCFCVSFSCAFFIISILCIHARDVTFSLSLLLLLLFSCMYLFSFMYACIRLCFNFFMHVCIRLRFYYIYRMQIRDLVFVFFSFLFLF